MICALFADGGYVGQKLRILLMHIVQTTQDIVATTRCRCLVLHNMPVAPDQGA